MRLDGVVAFDAARAMKDALWLLLPFSLLGCFDVERVDPGSEVEPFLVDDFESADKLPEAPFQQWACRAYQPGDDPTAVEECVFVEPAGNGSSTAFQGVFALRDLANGVSEYEGASLSASTTRPLDVRRYRELAVSLRFIARDQVVGNALNALYVELTCRSAAIEGASGSVNEVPSVVRRVTMGTSAWFSFRIPLSRFVQPTWQAGLIEGGPDECLSRIDSLAFVLSTDVPDGGLGRAELYIDDVSFE